MTRQRFTWFFALVIVTALAGCGDDSARYVELIREKVANKRELVQILESIKDETSLAHARPELEKLSQREAELANRFGQLPPPSEAIQERLEEELVPFQAAYRREKAETERIGRDVPGGKAFIDTLNPTVGGSSRLLDR